MGKSAVDKCIQCCNVVPVTFVFLLIIWSYYAYVVELCIMYVPEAYVKVLFLIVYHVALIMFGFSYISAMTARKIPVPDNFHLGSEEQALIQEAISRSPSDHATIQDTLKKRIQQFALPVVTRTPKGDIRFCNACKLIKPDRAHHCSTCQRCVLRMDHHCVWLGTCVGFHNHKQFFLFLLYTLLYATFIIATCLPYTVQLLSSTTTIGITSDHATPYMFRGGNDIQDRPARINLVLLPVISLAIALGVGLLGGHQCWLISRNRTGLEGLQKPVLEGGRACESLYDVGSCSGNWRALFGVRTLYWFLPIFSSELDGVAYPTRLDGTASRSYRQLRDGEDVAIAM